MCNGAGAELAPVTRAAHEGQARWQLGMLLTFKATGDDTNGEYWALEGLAPRSADRANRRRGRSCRHRPTGTSTWTRWSKACAGTERKTLGPPPGG